MFKQSKNIFKIKILLINVLCCFMFIFAQDIMSWDFSGDSPLSPGKWVFFNDIKDSGVSNQTLQFKTIGNDPYFYINNLKFAAEEGKYIIIRMRSTRGAKGEIFFNVISQANAIGFSIISDNKFHTYTVPVHTMAAWKGDITSVRIDPENKGLSQITIDSIRIVGEPEYNLSFKKEIPQKIITTAGSKTQIKTSVVNTSGSVITAIRAGQQSKFKFTPDTAGSKKFDLTADASKDLLWELLTDEIAAGKCQLILKGDQINISKEVDVVCQPAMTTLTEVKGVRFKIFAASLQDISIIEQCHIPVPGDILSFYSKTGAGEAVSMVLSLINSSDENILLNIDIPASKVESDFYLKLDDMPAGWTVESVFCKDTNNKRKINELGFIIKNSKDKFNTYLWNTMPDIASLNTDNSYICYTGRQIPVFLYAVNFDKKSVEYKIEYKVNKDNEEIFTQSVSEIVQPLSSVIIPARDLIPAESGRFTLNAADTVSEKKYNMSLSIINSDSSAVKLNSELAKQQPYTADLTIDQRKVVSKDPIDLLKNSTADIDLVSSELSPAILLHSGSDEITLFGRLKEFGLGYPTRIIYAQKGGVASYPVSKATEFSQKSSENWIVFYFNSAEGWDKIKYSQYVQNHTKDYRTFNQDTPFLAVFEHKPASIYLTNNGINVNFTGSAGYIAVMPLFGTRKLTPEYTAKWEKSIPESDLNEMRFWSRALIAYPVSMTEDFSINTIADTVSIREKYQILTIKDDWGTKPLYTTPISPAISLAIDYGFPAAVEGDIQRTGYVSHFGSLSYVKKAAPEKGYLYSTYTISNMLTYINDIQQIVSIPDDTQTQKLQDEFVRHIMDEKLYKSGVGWFGGASASRAQGFKTTAIPFTDRKEADQIKAVTQDFYDYFVFIDKAQKYVMYRTDNPQKQDILVDSYNHKIRYEGDDAAGSGQLLKGMWSYAYYTGDWDTIRRNWDKISKAFNMFPWQHSWIIQSRPNTGGDTFNDLLLGLVSYARMAAVIGDARAYRYAAYLWSKNIMAYYNYEYSSLRFAQDNLPWIVPLPKEPAIVWDYYTIFGPFFAPVSANGFYGAYSGFYEHYFRMGEGEYGPSDVMYRFYNKYLNEHAKTTISKIINEDVPRPERRDQWELQCYIRDRILNEDVFKFAETAKDSPFITRSLLERKIKTQFSSIIGKSILSVDSQVYQPGVAPESKGVGHSLLLVSARDYKLNKQPTISWFGQNSSGMQLDIHKKNLFCFGIFSPDPAAEVYEVKSVSTDWVTGIMQITFKK